MSSVVSISVPSRSKRMALHSWIFGRIMSSFLLKNLRQFTIRIGKRLELRVARFYTTPLMLHLLRTCCVLKPMKQTATPRRIGIIIAGAAHNEAAFVYGGP